MQMYFLCLLFRKCFVLYDTISIDAKVGVAWHNEMTMVVYRQNRWCYLPSFIEHIQQRWQACQERFFLFASSSLILFQQKSSNTTARTTIKIVRPRKLEMCICRRVCLCAPLFLNVNKQFFVFYGPNTIKHSCVSIVLICSLYKSITNHTPPHSLQE